MIEQRDLKPELVSRVSPAAKWTLAIVGLLGANFAAMMFLVAEAHRGQSRVIPGYYERATHYDAVLDQAARNRQLGWALDVAIAHGVVTVRAFDHFGAPLTGARVQVDGSERVRDRQISRRLIEIAPGQYRERVDGLGWMDLAIAIERAGDRFVREISVEAQ